MKKWFTLLLPVLVFSIIAWGCASSDDSTDGDTSDGDTADGDSIDGDTSDGDTADGDTADGDATDGDAADGDTADGDEDGDAIDGDEDGDMEEPVEMMFSDAECVTPETGFANVIGSVTYTWGFAFEDAVVKAGELAGGLDNYGFFYLCNVPADVALNIVLTFPPNWNGWAFNGLAPMSRRVYPTDGQTLFVVFEPKASTFAELLAADIATGATASDAKTDIEFSANPFVDANGDLYTGDVQVQITTFDASDPNDLEAFPGDFVGVDNEEGDGGETAIVSFGFVDVNLFDPDLNPLAMGAAATATLNFPVTGLAGDETTIPIWYFDEALGLWVREGEGAVDQGSGMISAEVTHFSTWNADKPITLTDCVKGVLQDEDGNPIAGIGVTGLGQGRGASDADGNFCVNFYPRASFDIKATGYIDGTYYKSVEPLVSHAGDRDGGQSCEESSACATLADPVVVRGIAYETYCLNVVFQDGDGAPITPTGQLMLMDVEDGYQTIYAGLPGANSVCVSVPAGRELGARVEGNQGQENWMFCYPITFNGATLEVEQQNVTISEGQAGCGDEACDDLVMECMIEGGVAL